MRMRKLSWAEDYLKEQDVVVDNVQAYKGKWKSILGKDQLHVEIGSGKGDYWIHMGMKYPDVGWIGIEKNTNVAALAVRKFVELDEPLNHMRFIQGDAEALETWFDQHEIDVLHLNFSDPWPKKRAHKKRLSHASFLQKYANVLSETGEIQMKTDNSSLFEFSILQFQEAMWYLHDVSVDYRRVNHDEDCITEYESRFLGLGQPIYRGVWRKYPYVNEDAKKR